MTLKTFVKAIFSIFSCIYFVFIFIYFMFDSSHVTDVKAHYWIGQSILDHITPVPGRKFPCSGVDFPEFHSLRPYQASNCGDSQKASYCWNNYVLAESFSTTWSPTCDKPGDFYQCPYNEEIEKVYAIDGEIARFPIMGNTEWVINSTDSQEDFQDPQKVNEYLSWYLHGVIGRAEYGPLSVGNISNRANIDRIVSSSGPINRLVPQSYIEKLRIDTITDAETEFIYEGEATGQPLHHNQIVVCTSEILGVGSSLPTPCYHFGAANTVYRLLDWGSNETLSVANTVVNLVGQFLESLALRYPNIPLEVLSEALSDPHWNSRQPPMPWGLDLNGEEMTALKYQKYYREWRGETCLIIPILNKLYCFENLLVPNKYADLFPYVPLANTTDKNANHLVNSFVMTPNPGTIAYFKQPPSNGPIVGGGQAQPTHTGSENPDVIHQPVLYYPHTYDTYIMSEFLNTVFTPVKDEENITGFTSPPDYEIRGCEIVDVRSNPGDYLFPSSQDSGIDDLAVYVDVQIDAIGCPAGPIDAWRVACNDDVHGGCEIASICERRNTDTNPDNNCGSCIGTYPDQCRNWPICSGDIQFVIKTTPKIPYAKDIWRSTVVGPESTFRKIFPKTGEDTPIECIADIPGTTAVYYAPLPDPGYTPLVSIETPVTTHNAAGRGFTASELYFPYQGTVYEYFLRGIQTALKPLGFGNPIPQGELCNVVCGELPELPNASASCGLKSVEVNGNHLPDSLVQIIESAAETYQVPAGLVVGVLFGEGVFNQPPKYDFTETNVINWATCEPLPDCSDPGSSIVSFFDPYWENLAQRILPDLQELDPNKTEADPCNLLDAIYALTSDLYQNQFGNPAWPSNASCNGLRLNRGSSTTNGCNWQPRDINTAIRVWEFGTCFGNCPDGPNGVLTCATNEDSCFTGGGVDAQCSTDRAGGPYDTCNNSTGHNQCVFEVATSH